MYPLITIGVLCCIFTTGNAITCNQCTELTSTKEVPFNLASANFSGCSGTLEQTECSEEVTSCMTWITNAYLQDSTGEVVNVTYKHRACSLPGASISQGDVCLDHDKVGAIEKLNMPDPASFLPSTLNFTFVGSNTSICVCDNSSICTPPSPGPVTMVINVTDPAPGKSRTCVACKELTSDDVSLDDVNAELVSCSDNPGEMDCPEGVLTCMTGAVNVAYRLDSGQNVMLVDERRACAPEEIASMIPPGDLCLDQAVVDAYFSANDPADIYPSGEGMTFDRILNATFCVCDSADNCDPPSHDHVAETGPNAGGPNTEKGKSRTCVACKELTSDDVSLDDVNADLVSCSDNPGEMDCPEGVLTCMTGAVNVAYRLDSGQNVILVDERRACAPEEIASMIPPGDLCLEQAVVDAYFSANDPADIYPSGEGMTFDRILNATFCVCDSADNCDPPSPDHDAETGPNAGGPNTGEGKSRTCIACKELTSDDVSLDDVDAELVSCSDNPGEMDCQEGVMVCMTGVVNVAYWLDSGQNVMLVDERRACAPEEIASVIPPGDQCLDKAVVDAYFSANDPADIYSSGEGMTFDRILNATFCVCDSADNCDPPSPDHDAETGPNAGGPNTGKSDSLIELTTPNSRAVNLGSTFALVMASLIQVFL